MTPDELDDLEDAPDAEVEDAEDRVVDQASAARTIAELEVEIGLLRHLEELAHEVRRGNTDRKWDELSKLLQDNPEMFDVETEKLYGWFNEEVARRRQAGDAAAHNQRARQTEVTANGDNR